MKIKIKDLLLTLQQNETADPEKEVEILHHKEQTEYKPKFKSKHAQAPIMVMGDITHFGITVIKKDGGCKCVLSNKVEGEGNGYVYILNPATVIATILNVLPKDTLDIVLGEKN